MPIGSPKTERNTRIKEFIEINPEWSYQLVADKFGVTRNTIAGLVFRWNHPPETRVNSPNGVKNKVGTGWRPHSYEPAYKASTHAV